MFFDISRHLEDPETKKKITGYFIAGLIRSALAFIICFGIAGTIVWFGFVNDITGSQKLSMESISGVVAAALIAFCIFKMVGIHRGAGVQVLTGIYYEQLKAKLVNESKIPLDTEEAQAAVEELVHSVVKFELTKKDYERKPVEPAKIILKEHGNKKLLIYLNKNTEKDHFWDLNFNLD